MPKCHLCGYEYENASLPIHGDEAKYCVQCGARMGDPEETAIPTSPEWVTTDTEELLEISRTLSSTFELHLLLRKIDDSAVRLTGAAAGSIMLFDEDKKSLRFRSLSGEKASVVKWFSVANGIAWWVAQHGEVARVNDAASDERFTANIDKISGFKTESVLCVPVILEDEIIGVIEVLNKVAGTGFDDKDERLLFVLANQAAVVVKNARLAMEQRNFFTHVIEILVTAIESTLLVPEGHCWTVSRLATAMGRALGMEDQELQDLYYAAALHHLGLLSLRQSRTGKSQPMKSYPILGARMVRTIDLLRGTEPIILHQCEHFDGSGYPDGLKGEGIPLGARIIAVVEAYEKALSEGENHGSVEAEIQENSGKLFDPVVVDAFLELVVAD